MVKCCQLVSLVKLATFRDCYSNRPSREMSMARRIKRGRHYAAILPSSWHNTLNIAERYAASSLLIVTSFVLECLSKSIGSGGSEDSGLGDAVGETIEGSGHMSRKFKILRESLKDGRLISSQLLTDDFSSRCPITFWYHRVHCQLLALPSYPKGTRFHARSLLLRLLSH